MFEVTLVCRDSNLSVFEKWIVACVCGDLQVALSAVQAVLFRIAALRAPVMNAQKRRRITDFPICPAIPERRDFFHCTRRISKENVQHDGVERVVVRLFCGERNFHGHIGLSTGAVPGKRV